jgi:hypothetical protein
MLLTLAAFSLSTGGCDAPGEGRVAELGRIKGAQLIRGVESFHSDSARYPKSLDELTPRYLSHNDLIKILSGPPRFDYIYNAPESYELIFRYTGPGVNTCSHVSGQTEAAWSCSGYY